MNFAEVRPVGAWLCFTVAGNTVIGILVVIALASGPVFGQGFSAAISGVVRDTTGAVLPGVSITATHTESGLMRTTISNETGSYSLPTLPVGPYEVTTDLPGFKQQVRRGITLAIGQEAVVNLTLEVGAIAEKVEVTEEAPLVNTTLSSTSGLINEGQIKDLPLNGRSFEQLLTLNTGTVNNNVHSTGSSFSVGGKRTETNRFTMNGVDYIGDNATGQYIAPQGASQQLLGVDAVPGRDCLWRWGDHKHANLDCSAERPKPSLQSATELHLLRRPAHHAREP